MKFKNIYRKLYNELFHSYSFEVRAYYSFGLYYIDVSDIVRREAKKWDEGQRAITEDSLSNPVTMCFCALREWDRYFLTKDIEPQYTFLEMAQRLINNQTKDGSWLYGFKNAEYNSGDTWISGMAQGLAISVLIRAYRLTGDREYLERAFKAADILITPIEKGGCLSSENGMVFFQEVACFPPASIMNGCIFSIWGLNDMEELTNEYRSIKLEAIRSIVSLLPEFDCGYWSRYDLISKVPCSRGYHLLHIEQLKALYNIYNDDTLKYYSIKWYNYYCIPYYRVKAFLLKSLYVLRRYNK